MVLNREQAAQRAEMSKTNTPGYCQNWTWNMFDAFPVGDVDKDGDADAVDGWKSEPRGARHYGDRNPPRGVPVAWSGGRSGFGHRAISLGGGFIRSTDAGGRGIVATVPIRWVEQNWGLRYLGWSETISGREIPKEKEKPLSNFGRADKKTQWFADDYPGSHMVLTKQTMVLVLHTTEGTTWPSYSGGATAPNYTGLPPLPTRRGKWRAHFPDEMSARALRNESGGVETNTLNCVQLELIGTCAPAHRDSWNGDGKYIAGKHYVYWPKATKRQLRWVARIVADFHRRHGLEIRAPREFKPYPASYGNNGVRLSGSAWRNTTGIVGHQHVPENSHGDPGNINISYILYWAKFLVKATKLLPSKK